MSYEKFFDHKEDGVDPRVQVELERLNSSTDEINKLEVDLDEARNQFRQLLQESTSQIESSAKKLGSCIVKVRPYYDARMRAKEALQETQKAAMNFERANSAHAAAKEMVFLAEEGLKAEGRTFDHAWQEMLNHATMRVNESEAERTRCESEHKKTSQHYQIMEMRVHTLQKELKRAITKSRPYFELKIHCNQLLEKQKKKVKNLEKKVAEVKLNYAHTLKNLEQISDEIHKTRQKNKGSTKLAKQRSEVVGEEIFNNEIPHLHNSSDCAKTAKSFHNDSHSKNEIKSADEEIESETSFGSSRWIQDGKKNLFPISETHSSNQMQSSTTTTFSSQPDTDVWSECSDGNLEASPSSENDSSLTGLADTEPEDDTFKVSGSLISNGSLDGMVNSTAVVSDLMGDKRSKVKQNLIENFNQKTSDKEFSSFAKSICTSEEKTLSKGVGICSFPIETELNLNFNGKSRTNEAEESQTDSGWTEIKLRSPEEEIFSTMKVANFGKSRNQLEEEFDIPYAPLAEFEGESNCSSKPKENKSELVIKEKSEVDELLCGLGSAKRKNEVSDGEELSATSLKGTPKKQNLRRQSLDALWNSTAGEKVKEMLSQSIMKLNIGSLTERKSSESKFDGGSEYCENEKSSEEIRGNDSAYESNLSSQFGLHFFNRKNSKAEDEIQTSALDEKRRSGNQDLMPNHIKGLISRKERFFAKKAPSPLEKTFLYLNADEESNSDSDSLTSLDMLTDEQLSSLVLDRDLTEIYQDIV